RRRDAGAARAGAPGAHSRRRRGSRARRCGRSGRRRRAGVRGSRARAGGGRGGIHLDHAAQSLERRGRRAPARGAAAAAPLPPRGGDGARFVSFLRRTAGAVAEAHKSLTVALPLREARGWTRLASDLDYGAVARFASWVVLTPPARMPRTVPPRPPTAAELAA